MKKWLIVVVLGISAMAHGVNMLGFPYWENDEGVYVSQAWAVWARGQLSHYTYWYDHAPGGWLTIAGWQMVSGLMTFGSTVDSGRVLMWVLHIASSGMVLVAARKLSGRSLGGYLAVLVFSLSPLAIYFQRRVLLDNIMVWWVLVAWVMVLGNNWKLWSAIASGAIFGWAVLTKEVAVYFLPGMLYALGKKASENRPFVVVLWLTMAGLVVGSYLLLAGFKGELWPVGWGGSSRERVSLLGSLTQQLRRGPEVAFWHPESLFYQSWQSWMHKDELMIVGGVVALVVASGLSWRVKHLREVVVMAWGFGIFLLRSRLVIDFYVVPLIPFAALAYGLGVEAILGKLERWKGIATGATVGVVAVTAIALGSRDIGQYNKQETKPQRQAVAYIREKLPNEAVIVADNSIWLDLQESFPNVEWAWKVEKDKEVFEKKLLNDWRNIDYVVVSHEILKQIRDFEAKFIKEALGNSRNEAMWTEGSTSYLDVAKYISTNGDWMGLYKVNDKDQIVLDAAWREYKKKFIHEYGRVVDPAGEKTTSEGQAYAMLRAVWQDDREIFDGLWAWTRDHLQFRERDKLFSWWWSKQVGVVDAATASDADVDIAWALAMAASRWKEEKYLLVAKEILKDIWRNEVVVIEGKYLLVSGSGAKRPRGYLVNPSYFSPAAYRIFQKIDPDTPWEMLAYDSYWWLKRIKGMSVNQVGLVPNWVRVSETDGSRENAPTEVGDGGKNYGFDAFRIYWRVAVDAMWYGGEEAKEFLRAARDFWATEWRDKRYFAAEYDLEGNSVVEYGSLANTVGPLAVFKVADPQLAQEVYSQFFEKDKLEELNGYWGEENNYYDQNWGWFGVALFTDKLPNL